MKITSTLSRKFITYSTIVLTLILWIYMILIYNKNKNLFEDSSKKELTHIKESLDNKGNLLLNMVSRISPEAIMSLDIYTLKAIASEVMHDDEVVSIEIVGKENKQLLNEKKDDDGYPVVYFEKEVITDKEKLNIEMVTGKIKIGMSTANYKKAEVKNAENLKDVTKKMIFSFLGITVLINILISITMVFILNKVVIKQIVDITQRVRDIAEGEGDLTKRIRINEEDEIGDLADAFNQFVDKLHKMIQTITNHTSNVNESAEELAALSVKANNTTQNVSSQTNAVSQTTEHTTDKINSIAKNTNEMSKSVITVASSIEEMNASLNEVARNCQKESQIAAQANSQAESTQKMMQRLDESSKKIGSVIELINSIADQTNLLALNATIEAASAGEAGKGFAVVANEVKELAKQTAQATEEISVQISEMTLITNDSIKSIDDITKIIEEVNVTSQTIVTSVEQQSATINEIANTIGGASNFAAEISSNVSETASGLNEVTSNIQQVNESVKDNVQNISLINSNASKVKELAGSLFSLIRRFKI